MRKTLLYSIAVSLLTLLSSGCVNEEVPGSGKDGDGEQQYATFTFTPRFNDGDVQTRAMALNPNDPTSPTGSQIRNIYFAVFDAAGYKLSEYAEAVPNSYATENGVVYSYSVRLTVTDEKRIVHIIANAPEKLPYGSEEEVIGGLNTYLNAAETGKYDRQEAYWERLELDGVYAEPDIQLQTDAPDKYAEQYAKYRSIVEKLGEAKLTRNFCQISLVNGASGNFEVTGFLLTNVPDRGSIAPYNRNEGKFQNNYNQWNTITTMMASDKGNYQGFTPAGTEIIGYDELSEAELESRLLSPTASAFCYEREIPKTRPLYLIIAGKYNHSSTVTYYKIDLKDDSDQYFPIMRNFNYRVNIESVSRPGASTIKGALSAAPSGDISTNLDLQELTNISNGVAQMFVTETSRVLVGESEIQLRYKFIPDIRYDNAANTTVSSGTNPYVTIEREPFDGSSPVFYPTTTDNSTSGVVVAGSDDGSGWRTITLKPYAPNDIVKTEVITITGHYYTGKWESISRTVTYKLRNKLTMDLTCSPTKVANLAEQAIDVIIGLEPGLPSSIFSLNMDIESNGLALTPNNDLIPVNSAYSTIPGKESIPSFYYTKTITWTEYLEAPLGADGKKHFTCHFKTNKPVTSSDQIYVSNHYFNQANTSYTTFTPKTFSGLTFKESGANVTESELGDNLTFSFSMSAVPSDNKVKVYMLGLESTDSGLTFIGSDEDGYEIYEMTVGSTTASFSLSPYSVGTATIKLEADEFRTSEKDINVVLPGSTSYSLESGSIEVYRINTSNRFGNGTEVSYYYSDPKSGHVHAAGSFTLNTNNRNGSNVTIPAVPGSTIYFSAVYNGETYYGSANIDELDAARNETGRRYNLILNTYPPKRIIEASSLNIYRINSSLNFGNGTTVTYYTSDPQSGSPDPLGTFTVANNNKNAEFEIPYDLTGTLYFKVTYNSRDYYASATVSAVDDATTGSPCTLTFNTNPPMRIIEAGSLNIYRINTSNNFGATNTISYYFSDPRLGSVDPAGTFTTNRNGYSSPYTYRNNDFEIPADASGTIYFTATYNSRTYYAEASVSDIDNATSTNTGRYDLIFQTNPPTWTIEANSVNIYRYSTSNKVAQSTTINYYYSDPRLGSVTAAGNFRVNSSNRNNDFSPEVASGSTIYFSYTADSKTYYAEATVNQLDNATNDNSNRWNLIFDTNPPHETPSLYADAAHTDASATDLVSSLTGADVTGSGQLVVGQTGKLTVYVSDYATSIQIGTLTANRVTSGSGATISKDGKTYYAYTTSNNYTATAGSGTGGAGYNSLDVTFDGETIGSVSVPVWGIQEGTQLSSVSFNTSKYYLIKNYDSGRYLYNRNSTGATSILQTTLNYFDLVKFGSTASKTTVDFVNAGTQYYLGSTGDKNVGISTSAYSWTVQYDSTKKFRFSRNSTNYIYDNKGSIEIAGNKTTDNNRYWRIYEAKFVDPSL